MTAHLRLTTLVLIAALPRATFAGTPDPQVHAAAARLTAARASVYRARAVDLVVDSPRLLASGSPNPPINEGWRIVHPKGHTVPVNEVAAQLHRSYELAEYERQSGVTGMWVGALWLGGTAALGASLGVLSAAGGGKDLVKTLGPVAAASGLASLATLLVSYAVYVNSDPAVPLDVGRDLVSTYNASLVDQLDPAAATSGAPAPNGAGVDQRAPLDSAAADDDQLRARAPVSISAPAERAGRRSGRPVVAGDLGCQLLDSEGVRVVFVHDAARATQLRAGDVLLAVDGIPLPHMRALSTYLGRLRPGDHIVVRVRRANGEHDVSITL